MSMRPRVTEDDLRDVILSSDERWSSLTAAGNSWQDRIGMRHALASRRGRFAGATPAVAPPPLAQGTREQPWRLWRGGSALLRTEFTIGREYVTVVGQGPRWWRTSPTLGSTSGSGAGRPLSLLVGPVAVLLSAPNIITRVDIAALSETTALGRPALRARVVPADDRPRTRLALRAAGAGADEYELIVDRERGVLLSITAFFQTMPFQSLEVAQIDYDVSLDPSLFTPESPSGGTSRRNARMTLDEVATAAHFAVFTLEPPPALAPPYATLVGGDGRIAGPDRAIVVYALPGSDTGIGRGQLRVTQSSLPLPAGPSSLGWTEVDGVEWREESHGSATRGRARVRVEGTYIELESNVLDIAQLIELAHRLVRIEPA
jgi:hypothetical protein